MASWRKLSYKLKHDYLVPENIVLIVAIALCLAWTFQSIEAMNRNWELTERLNAERKTLELLSVEVEAAELENEYLQSAEYRELAARKLLSKQLSGEHLVVLPENSEAAKNKHSDSGTIAVITADEPEYSNFEKWLQYLFPSH